MYNTVLSGKRFFTINRSFQAGMQSYPAITWTGDRQDCSHKTVLTFTTAGQLFTACDMAAPDTAGLVRQYQNAVFLPIMRTHAMHGTPRFPFLWGYDAEPAFRKALELRYHFVPHILSLVYLARETGQPIALPASYIFPNDPTFPTSLGDATYMFSDVLLPADVSTSNTPDINVNTTHCNIPPGIWYTFNSTTTLVGPITDLTYNNVPLDQIILFVRSGAILTLNRDIVQYTDSLGGALEVQVYGGRDGKFELVEDDGESLDYITSPSTATRRTLFTWTDSTRTLSWSVSGGYSGGKNIYTLAYPVLFTPNASAPVFAASQALGVSGFVVFGTT
jgi:alpha-glucosidase